MSDRVQAYWNGTLIADSDDTVIDDGTHYFPSEAVRRDLLQASETRTVTPEKGEARFYHLMVGHELNADAAWTYPNPAPAARRLKGRFAFWHGVEVETGRTASG